MPDYSPGASAGAEPPWTRVIRPGRGWFELNLRELWDYRDLVRLFVRRDFVGVYKQTILGPAWYLIGPLSSSLVFTVIFSRIVGIPTGGVPPFLFYLSGNICWTYLASCVNGTASSFTANAGLFAKVYFPRVLTPLSTVISNLIGLGVQFLALAVLTGVFMALGADIHVSWTFLLLPVVIAQIAMLGLAIGMIVASLTVKYRDLVYMLAFGMQLWMYSSPIIYPLSQVPSWIRHWYSLNPVVGIVGLFRHAVLGAELPELRFLATSWAITATLFVVGVLLFNRAEKSFLDVV